VIVDAASTLKENLVMAERVLARLAEVKLSDTAVEPA
jgi:hypothetical protein